MQPVPTSPSANSSGFSLQDAGRKTVFEAIASAAAHTARRSQAEGWADLKLRQDFMDAVWMKEHIKAAGLRSPFWREPASATRLRSLLHKAGIGGATIKEAIGTTLGGYLTMNPLLPLWAALALVLEATERFTPETVSQPRLYHHSSCTPPL